MPRCLKQEVIQVRDDDCSLVLGQTSEFWFSVGCGGQAPVFAVGFVPREQLETLTCPEPDSELVWTCSLAQGL